MLLSTAPEWYPNRYWMGHYPLAELLLAAAGQRGARFAATPELETAIGDLFESGRTAWPDVALDAPRFVRHLALHLPEDPTRISRLHAGDLYLACACVDGDRRALEHFERRFLARVSTYVGKLNKSETFTDDVRQLLREKLFVPTNKVPKIADYSGLGPLEQWLRVAAIRTAQNLLRAPKPNVPLSDDEARALQDHAPNPELDYLRTRYAHEFMEVFRAVLAEQPAKDKNLLSLYFVDGLRSAAIGKLYNVHGATIRRWIEQARETLLHETRSRLALRLNLTGNEFESLMVLIQSQLDLTISRCLGRGKMTKPAG